MYGAYDKLDGHFRRYSRPLVRTLLRHVPLEPLRMHYFNAVGAVGWWLQYRILKKTVHADSHLGLISRLTPVLQRVESVVKPPFGLSLVAICRRQ